MWGWGRYGCWGVSVARRIPSRFDAGDAAPACVACVLRLARFEILALALERRGAGFRGSLVLISRAAADTNGADHVAAVALDISMGVRRGDEVLRDELNGVLVSRQAEIAALLAAHDIPLHRPTALARGPQP